MPTELINRLRILLRDVQGEVTVQEGVVVPGHFWTDDELTTYLESALTIWNLWEPVSNTTPADMGVEGRRHLLWGAAAIAAQVVDLFPEEMADNCPYEYDGAALATWITAKDQSLRRVARSAGSKWEQARLKKAA